MFIVFKFQNGSPAIMTPASCGLSVEQIAVKDVPKNMPFWIIQEDTFSAMATEEELTAFFEGLGEPDGYGCKSE